MKFKLVVLCIALITSVFSASAQEGLRIWMTGGEGDTLTLANRRRRLHRIDRHRS